MSPHDLWSDVDRYFANALLPDDPVLDEALGANAAAGLPAIDVAPNQGKLLNLLARIQGARSILEVGTLGGYSTIWLGRALPADGHLVSLELDPKHADVARANVARAGLAERVTIRVGPAMDSLAALQREGAGPFDFVFIDADKPNNPGYVGRALELTHIGSVIIVDNVVRAGQVIDSTSEDARVKGTRSLFDKLSRERRLDATAIQTVGSKGHDGFVIGRVVAAG